MPRYSIHGDAAEIGALVIDWAAREFKLFGASGVHDELNQLSLAGLRALAAQHEGSPDVACTPFIVYDTLQLAAHGDVHDVIEGMDDFGEAYDITVRFATSSAAAHAVDAAGRDSAAMAGLIASDDLAHVDAQDRRAVFTMSAEETAEATRVAFTDWLASVGATDYEVLDIEPTAPPLR